MLAIIAILYIKIHNRKEDFSTVKQLQNIVMESKTEEKEAETFSDGLNSYEIKSNPPQKGLEVNENAAAMDVLYSVPEEASDNTYSHLRDNEKMTTTRENEAVICDQYSKLNHGQIDPVATNNSTVPHIAPVDEGVMYAVPDKTKKKTKKAHAPSIPDKSSELTEYLDTKKTPLLSHSQQPTSDDKTLPEYSEISDRSRLELSGSVCPVPLSNSASLSYVNGLNSNPIYETTDIVSPDDSSVPHHLEYGNGGFSSDDIYTEPLPPGVHKLEWDPDQNIYESIYSEPLKPSLFMQESDEVDAEDLRPYSSIYTAPVVPSGDQDMPLQVSVGNIKEIKCLGEGNFGQVILAQTIGLSSQDLGLEGDAPYILVAVKKLKENASERNKELFDKEVKFMSRLNHPNVTRLLGVCHEEAAPFIMMEYMKNGDLNQYLKGFHSVEDETYGNMKPIDTSTMIYMCTQIASAMQYLTSRNFVHRDLATRNCLVGTKNTIKLSDFGMSRSLYESQYYVISGHAILPIRWMATECFYGKFSAKTDVWAFGVTMWEIFTLVKDQPYTHLKDREVVEDAIKGPDRVLLERPSRCPEDVYAIMKKCWIYDAGDRPTFDELVLLLSNI